MSALHLSCCAPARLRVRGLCLVISLCLAVAFVFLERRLPAFWSNEKSQQPAEPVGAVDENDLAQSGQQ